MKPLSEWTLGEIKQRCDSCCAIPEDCVGCPALRANGDCAIGGPFGYWDLSEPPKWTKQDKEDAKAIRHIISCRGLKYGRSAATGKLYVMWDGSNNVCDIDAITDIGLNPNLLPSLKPGEVVTLDEIIGGGE